MTKVEISYSNIKNNGNDIVDLVAHHLRQNQDDLEIWKFMLIDFKHLKKIEKMMIDEALLIYVDLDLLGTSLERLVTDYELIEDSRFRPVKLISQGAVMVFRDGEV